MSKPKLTPWYPASVKPVRVGRYRVYMAKVGGTDYSYGWLKWNGKRWLGVCVPPFGSAQKDKWRGLAQKP